MELDIRLNILKDSNQISQDTYEKVIHTIAMFKDKYEISLNEENGAMLITHLSCALERIKKGDELEKLEEFLVEQVKGNGNYKKAQAILSNIEDTIKIDMPMEEKNFMLMHICTLLEKENI